MPMRHEGARLAIGVIADDFTGASDIANTLARAGARTLLSIGTPAGGLEAGPEAIVIALKTRSIPASEAVAQSLAACRALAGASKLVFKICSTFDSTPAGNIGPVAEALLDELGEDQAIVCPAFPANRRTVYQGHLFVGDRPLNESGMQNHPLNPMTDADLRRVLGRQTNSPAGLLDLATLRGGDAAAGLAAAKERGERLIIADAIEDDDLRRLVAETHGQRLAVGGSGIAIGLPALFGLAPDRPRDAPRLPDADAPTLLLAGSCSAATRGQIAAHALAHPVLRLTGAQIISGDMRADRAWDWVRQHAPQSLPLVASSAEPDDVKAAQARFGPARLAAAIEAFFGALAQRALQSGMGRLVVAGGETASAVVQALGLSAFGIGPEIDPGVPILEARTERPLRIALKSGNFGAPDFFEKAARMMESP
jgi:3-dehydrotetronate 4-kinase